METKHNLETFEELFKELNKTKFNNKLPNYKIEFKNMPSYFGRVWYNKKLIQLNPNYNYESIANTLLHELIHADFRRRGFNNTSHSVRFWREFSDKGGVITDINKSIFKKAKQVSDERNGR